MSKAMTRPFWALKDRILAISIFHRVHQFRSTPRIRQNPWGKRREARACDQAFKEGLLSKCTASPLHSASNKLLGYSPQWQFQPEAFFCDRHFVAIAERLCFLLQPHVAIQSFFGYVLTAKTEAVGTSL